MVLEGLEHEALEPRKACGPICSRAAVGVAEEERALPRSQRSKILSVFGVKKRPNRSLDLNLC
jgi:hypothetical protein